MMYGDSDAAPDLGPPPERPQGPGDGVRLPGLERRRETPPRAPSRSSPARSSAKRFARIDSEEFYDFQANRPCDPPRRGRAARDHLADGGDLRGAARRAPRATSCSCRASSRRCAGARSAPHLVDLAEALGVQVVVTLGALLGRRPAHPPGGDDRPRLRSLADGAPGHPASTYEGPTGIVGVLHTRLRRGRPAVGEPVGGRTPLRRGRHQPEGGARAAAPGRRPDRRLGRRLRARVGRGRLRAPGRPGGAERPRHPGLRRAPRAGRRERGESAARGRSLGRHPRARIPALPAPAGPRGSR